MARTFSVNARNYQPGDYGPFTIDAFTKNDAAGVEIELTVEGWPDVPVIATGRFDLGTVTGGGLAIPGVPRNRAGTPLTTYTLRLIYPTWVEGGTASKLDANDATLTLTLLQAIRTAITVRAI